MDLVRACGLEGDFVSKERVLRGDAVDCLLCPDPGIIILEAEVLGSIRDAFQLSSIFPGIGPAVIVKWVSYGVIGDGLSIVGCQLVLPIRIPISVGRVEELCRDGDSQRRFELAL